MFGLWPNALHIQMRGLNWGLFWTPKGAHVCTVGIDGIPSVWCHHLGRMVVTSERQLVLLLLWCLLWSVVVGERVCQWRFMVSYGATCQHTSSPAPASLRCRATAGLRLHQSARTQLHHVHDPRNHAASAGSFLVWTSVPGSISCCTAFNGSAFWVRRQWTPRHQSCHPSSHLMWQGAMGRLG